LFDVPVYQLASNIPASFFARFILFTTKQKAFCPKRYIPVSEAWVLRIVAFDELLGVEVKFLRNFPGQTRADFQETVFDLLDGSSADADRFAEFILTLFELVSGGAKRVQNRRWTRHITYR
jgi:hypothetical protein